MKYGYAIDNGIKIEF